MNPGIAPHLPNFISFARLALVPIILWCIGEKMHDAALFLFLGAALSDALDGAIARWFDLRSRLGAYLDAIADKCLLMGVFAALGFSGLLPSWIAFLVVFRDLFILGGALLLFLLGHAAPLAPLAVSKVNTAAQIALAAAALGGAAGYDFLDPALEPLTWAAAATTLISGLAYVLRFGRATMGRTESET